MAMTAATGFSSGADFDPRAEPSRGGGAYGDAELTVREEAYCALCEEDGAKRPPCCAYALCAACAAAHALVRSAGAKCPGCNDAERWQAFARDELGACISAAAPLPLGDDTMAPWPTWRCPNAFKRNVFGPLAALEVPRCPSRAMIFGPLAALQVPRCLHAQCLGRNQGLEGAKTAPRRPRI